jgi:hypothetical protein
MRQVALFIFNAHYRHFVQILVFNCIQVKRMLNINNRREEVHLNTVANFSFALDAVVFGRENPS